MNNAIRLGRLAGIDVKMHWTFLLLIAWVGGSVFLGGGTAATALTHIALILCVFVCVIAHEFGHALAARRYGVPTHDITLLPIGGVARLQRIPENPKQEFVIAIAGPLVNVVIAATLIAFILVFRTTSQLGEFLNPAGGLGSFVTSLAAINIALVVFNLIPAFPMDGGRMLRALLALRMDRVQATNIAAGVGQFLACCLGFMGLYGNPLLILIAIFVFFGARSEAEQVRSSTLIGDLPVRAAMIAQMRNVDVNDTLSKLREMLLEGAQQDFPVLDESGLPVGIVFRSDVIDLLQDGSQDTAVHDCMTSLERAATDVSTSLRSAMEQMQNSGVSALIVLNGGRLVGMLTRENIAELLMFRECDPSFVPSRIRSEEAGV